MSSSRLQPLTVLVVPRDGHRSNGHRPLSDADPAIDVRVVDSVDRAIERIGSPDAEDGGIDAVVCEHRPPVVDGVNFVAAVRERDAGVPVLVVAGGDGEDCAEAALAAGATDVVETPLASLSSAVLANRLRRLVRSGRASDGTQAQSRSSPTPRNDASESGEDPSADGLEGLREAVRRLHRADGVDGVADVLADETTGAVDEGGVGVFRFDDGDNLLRPAAMTGPMSDFYGGETVFGPGKPDSLTWQVFVTGETLAFDDIRTSGVHVNEETDARSGLFVPLGEHGVLVAATDVVGTFPDAARERVELLAATAESALDRIESRDLARRRDRQLRERDERIRNLDRITRLVGAADRDIVAAETRADVESAVVDRLTDEGEFEFAWIGTVDADDGRLSPRALSGNEDRYLDEVSLSIGESDEPACRTARTWQVTSVSNVSTELDGEGWERDALSREFHSVLSVPMMYDGVLYGVLTAYADRPAAFRERVSSALRQVAETAAYAINASERKFSAASNGVTELELRISDPDDVLNVVAEHVGATVTCRRLTPLADGSTEVVFSATDVSAESVLTTATGLVAVDSVRHLASDEAHLFRAVVDGETVGSVVAASGGTPEELVADGRSFDATVHVPDAIGAQTFVDRIQRRYPGAELRARRERDESAMTRLEFLNQLESALTDRQLEVLRTAYEQGFFRSPRDATGGDVADRLGVSQPTVSHHLRAGQGTLFALLFEDD